MDCIVDSTRLVIGDKAVASLVQPYLERVMTFLTDQLASHGVPKEHLDICFEILPKLGCYAVEQGLAEVAQDLQGLLEPPFDIQKVYKMAEKAGLDQYLRAAQMHIISIALVGAVRSTGPGERYDHIGTRGTM